MTLEEENKKLRKQLASAQNWIQREIHAKKEGVNHIDDMIGENISFHEEEVTEKIQRFLPPLVYMFLSDEELSCLISSELTYTNILEGELLDGMNVVLGYHKVVDAFIEEFITKGFRSFVGERNPPDSHDPLEAFFEQVHEKNYSLSFGRLYQILERIKQKKELFGYQKLFQEYIFQDSSLKKALLESSFFVQCGELVEGEYIGEKRHKGFLGLEETRIARQLYIGKLLSTDCLLGNLARSQDIAL